MVTDRSRIPTAPRHIGYVRLSDVQPAIRNPKQHDLPGTVASIQAHGFADAGILDERTHRLVAGHGRWEALIWMKAQGMRIPDGVMVDEDGEWLIPVQRGWSSKNDEHAEAFIIEHNHLVESGGWHEGMLVDMLHDVHVADAELFADMSWTADELDELFRRNDPERLDADPDDVPELPDEPADTPDEPEADDVVRDLGDDTPTPREKRIVECPCCFHQFIPGEDS